MLEALLLLLLLLPPLPLLCSASWLYSMLPAKLPLCCGLPLAPSRCSSSRFTLGALLLGGDACALSCGCCCRASSSSSTDAGPLRLGSLLDGSCPAASSATSRLLLPLPDTPCAPSPCPDRSKSSL
eukprot:1137439-Pelagomonas_calceolata.AAC.5